MSATAKFENKAIFPTGEFRSLWGAVRELFIGFCRSNSTYINDIYIEYVT